MRAFSSCGKRGPLLIVVRGPLFIAVRGPLTNAAPPVAGHSLQTRRLSSCGSRAQLLRGMWDFSQTRARTRVPCISRQILNHCATREAHSVFLLMCPLTTAELNSPIIFMHIFLLELSQYHNFFRMVESSLLTVKVYW